MTEEEQRTVKPRRLKSLRRLHIRSMAPNVITILALSAGMTSIRYALDGNWERAALAVIIAGTLDGIDGTIARLLKSASKFGAELDSLADVISFGVAPAVILYVWALNKLGGIGWVLALAFAVCCALRLARFNSKLEDGEDLRKKAGFLTGIPAPAAAGIAIIPLILEFKAGNGVFQNPGFVGIWTAVLCFGMVSRIATFSWKGLMISRDQMVPLLLGVGILAALLTVYTWWTLITFGLIYIILVPVAMVRYRRVKKRLPEEPEGV